MLIAAAVLVAAAMWSNSRRAPRSQTAAGRELLPALDLNGIAAVEIEGGEEQALRLERRDGVWVVANAFAYPADFGKLRSRLMALKDLKMGQLQRGMTLGTNEVTRIRLLDAQGGKLAALTLGARRQARAEDGPRGGYGMSEGRYVMRDGVGEVRLIKESLDDWNSSVEGWLDTQLLNIAAADIAAIEMRDPAGATVRLDRGSGSLKLEGLNEAREEFDTSRSYGIESAFNYLRFNSVADPSLDETQTGVATGHQFRAILKNGESYTARIGGSPENSSDRYLKLAVALAPATTNDAARAAQEKRVAELSAKLDPWTFLISSYTADNMTHSRTNLVTIKAAETNGVAAATNEVAAAEAATPAP